MSWLRRRGKSPEDRFADEMAALARAQLGVAVQVRPDFSLGMAMPDGTDFTLNLGTLFREVQEGDPADRQRRMRAALLDLGGPAPQTWDEAAARLMPAVRAVGWTAAMGPDVLKRSLAPFVSLMCAIDSEHSMALVTQADLDRWGVDGEQALRRAVENLRAQPVEVGMGRGSALITGPDGYASSWLVVPSLIEQVAEEVGGTVVAVAVERDSLVLVDVDDHAVAVEHLSEAVDRYLEAPRQLSPVPYVVGDGALHPWQPPAGHPAAALVSRARHLLAGREYELQRMRLEELHEASGVDVYVAKCDTVERPDGSLWSWTVCAREVTDGLLPQADVVVYGTSGGGDDPLVVRWDDVQRLAGHALEATGYDPPRWRHHGWPDEATLAALRAVAVPMPFEE